jgi:hypothetical protein
VVKKRQPPKTADVSMVREEFTESFVGEIEDIC